MQQRDYLQDQIEQFGKVLGQLIAGMLGRNIPTALESEAADELLREHAMIHLEDIPEMEPQEIERLFGSPLLQRSNAEKLAELLIIHAEQNIATDPEKARKATRVAKHFLHLTDRREGAVSISRMALLERCDPKHIA